MIWVFTALLTIILVEIFLRLPLVSTARGIVVTARRAMRALARRGASDHWKELVSRAYAGRMLRATLVLAGGLGLMAVVGGALSLGVERLVPGFGAALISWPGLVVSLIAATAYVMARARFVRR